jgi:transcriptional regulator with XRE-family HTH domain
MGSSEVGRTLQAVVIGIEESALKKRVATTPEGALAIAERVRAHRKARGISQVELAQQLGISQVLVSKYETGGLLLHGELIAKLAALLHVSTDELLGVPARRRRDVAPPPPPVDRGLARRFAQVQALPKRDRDALTRTIDAFLTARGSRSAA